MKFLRLLKSDFQRAVFSYSFLLCTVAVNVLVVTSGYTQLELSGEIMTLLQFGLKGNGVEMLILCILPLVPFAMSFAFEWKEKSYLFYISKVGPERYIISKMVISAVSGFLVLLIGVCLSVPILRLLAPQLPLTGDSMSGIHNPFWEKGQVYLGYFVYILDYALTACLTTVCGVWFSTYVPSPFAVLGAPLLFNFTLIRIGSIYVIEGIFDKYIFFNPVYWINATYPTDSVAMQLGYRIGNILLLSLIMGFFAVRKTKRRVLNG